jgi:carbon-monoxide dehydrogenase medium subunit
VDGLDHVREQDGRARHRRDDAAADGRAVRGREGPPSDAACGDAAHRAIRRTATRARWADRSRTAGSGAELPALALVLDAEMRAVGPSGERTIAAADFFVTYLTTALEPTRSSTETRFPTLPARTGWSVMEVGARHGDFALAGAMATSRSTTGAAARRRVSCSSASAPRRSRAAAAEQMLAGEAAEGALFERAGERGQEIDEPLSDVHASADYRRRPRPRAQPARARRGRAARAA